jgi:hypothetical protein
VCCGDWIERLVWPNLSVSQQQLSVIEAKLATDGVTGKSRGKNPVWRKLSAEHRQLRRRLFAVATLEKREAEAAQRKADKANGVEATVDAEG